MLYVIGDSHCDLYTFCHIPETIRHRLNAPTLKRVGYKEDSLIRDTVNIYKIQSYDTLILCFGEIDVRCWVKIHLQRSKIPLEEMLQVWVDRYLLCIGDLSSKYRIAIYSVPPPSNLDIVNYYAAPVEGTDSERAEYTKVLNTLLSEGCIKNNLLYIDAYSIFKDKDGMLPKGYTDGVHIIDKDGVFRPLLKSYGLVE